MEAGQAGPATQRHCMRSGRRTKHARPGCRQALQQRGVHAAQRAFLQPPGVLNVMGQHPLGDLQAAGAQTAEAAV